MIETFKILTSLFFFIDVCFVLYDYLKSKSTFIEAFTFIAVSTVPVINILIFFMYLKYFIRGKIMPKKIKTQTRDGFLTKKEFDDKLKNLYERITPYSRSNNELLLDIIGEVFVRNNICTDEEYLEIVNKKNEAKRIYRTITRSGEKDILQKLKEMLKEQGISEDYLKAEFEILESIKKKQEAQAPTIKISDVTPAPENEVKEDAPSK